MRRARLAMIGALATACSFDAGGGNGDAEGSSSGGTSTTGSTTMATTVATTMAETSTLGDSSTAMPETSSGEPGTSSSETGTPEELEHGFVKLQLRLAAGERQSTFEDTTRIQIGMSYEGCLFDFYLAHPEYAQTGDLAAEIWGPLDAGGEGWLDRLCQVDVPDLAECSVATFEQQLEMIPALRVNYMVGGDLDGRLLAFGPLPKAALAECMGGATPSVRLVNGGAVGGFDARNTKIWEGETFEPNAAATDDEAPIVVDVVAL